MANRKTTAQFISEAIAVHGDKYDYSNTEYKNSRTNVNITCPIHGEFYQKPNAHLYGNGCLRCHIETTKTLIYGVGYNDLLYTKGQPFYKHWFAMLSRCYQQHKNDRNDSYKNCSVCEPWHTLSNFKAWFEKPDNGYRSGYHLDKDILVKNNTIYSPETCCFVPPRINTLMIKGKSRRTKYPIGTHRVRSGKFSAREGLNTYLGTFNTPEEAFNAYKIAKEQHIKELANKYFKEGKITQRVYDALMKYEVEITD